MYYKNLVGVATQKKNDEALRLLARIYRRKLNDRKFLRAAPTDNLSPTSPIFINAN